MWKNNKKWMVLGLKPVWTHFRVQIGPFLVQNALLGQYAQRFGKSLEKNQKWMIGLMGQLFKSIGMKLFLGGFGPI